MSKLNEAVRALLAEAVTRTTDPSQAQRLEEQQTRLNEPLRVAIAGKVKAGKSTLLNALVGEELAPTDAGECTKIVTWYREGLTRKVSFVSKDGSKVDAPFERSDGAIEIALNGHTADDIERIEVEWPSSALREMTLIDTPGIGSLTSGISERTERFLALGEDRETPADAVIYLLKHLHSSDLDFLQAFHDDDLADASTVSAIALIARADEIGVGRIDSMASADRIAARYRQEPKLRSLVQTVMPVAALVGQGGVTLTEADFRALGMIAAMEEEPRTALLLTADRFADSDEPVEPSRATRRALLVKYGLFGVRVSVALIVAGEVTSAPVLAQRLVGISGLPALRTYLQSHFASKKDVLKARSALLALSAVAAEQEAAGDPWLAAEVERVQASAHEFVELGMLGALRASTNRLKAADLDSLERLFGRDGVEATVRLGLDPGASQPEVRSSAHAELGRWQRRAESPLSEPDVVHVSRAAMRTCEGILGDLEGA